MQLLGSFCNFSNLEEIINKLKKEKIKNIIPIVSYSVITETNRFSNPKEIKYMLETLTNNELIDTLSKAEPIGPKELIDILIILPCTGNTLSKLSQGITDTPVLMAAKSHIRNNKPVVIGISTNDGLGASFENIAKIFNTKNMYLIPFRQDNYEKKPKSLTYDYSLVIDTIKYALKNKQIQPLLLND